MVPSAGVLETSDQGDREAFQKAKILYKSCMNESESILVPLIDSPAQYQMHKSTNVLLSKSPVNIYLIYMALPRKLIFR